MSSTALRSSYPRSVLRPLVFISLAFLFALPLLADSHVRIVRLSYIDGDVQLDKADGRGFGTAYLNMPIVNQSKLWARDGQAEVELEDGSSIRLTPDTIIAFNDLSLDNNGGRSTSIELQQGTAYFDIRHRDADRFQLDFGRDRVSLERTARFRVHIDKHDFEVAVLSGEIQVANASNTEVAVKKGETIRLESDDPDRYYLAKGVDAENYDDWDNDRAKWHDQAVASNSYQNGNITYGLSDLSAYGNYFYVPGYGYMWRPYSAGFGWDPFADGYWISYPGFGYTFVSGYPWGWAPYRYGSWQFVNNYGWCWQPGSNWNNWQAIPPVHNIPPHFRPPLPPRNGAPVVVVNNGRLLPMPNRQMIVDNDAIEHHRPPASKITSASGEVVQQGSAPAQGFAAIPSVTSSAPATGTSIAPTPRVVGPRFSGPRWVEGERSPRQVQTPATQAPPTTSVVSSRPAPAPTPAAAPPQAAPTPPARMAPPAHNDSRPMMNPRMESHSSPPPMHIGGASSGAAMHSAPAMSSGGGMRMSAPSMGGGGGGMHGGGGGGGGGGGSSHGSHR